MVRKQEELTHAFQRFGYRNQDIARILGINQSTLSKKMHMENDFTWSEVCTLCYLLDIENPLDVIVPIAAVKGDIKRRGL